MIEKRKSKHPGIPGGLWINCPGCKKMIYKSLVEKKLNVCPDCNYHFRISAKTRINYLTDEGSFEEFLKDLVSNDPIGFRFKGTSYKKRLRREEKKSGAEEAMSVGRAFIKGRAVILAVMEPNFLMGSMGCVVGEKFCVAVEKAIEESLPLLAVISSSGARMHEGVFSLQQMAKVSAVLARFDESKGFYISVLTDPTMGGVAASFAFLADVVIAEPNAQIGFAGPRTIKETIKVELPKGFQTAEFVMEHGFIDMIVHRRDLRNEIARLIDYCSP